jgi:hypothetical protein
MASRRQGIELTVDRGRAGQDGRLRLAHGGARADHRALNQGTISMGGNQRGKDGVPVPDGWLSSRSIELLV